MIKIFSTSVLMMVLGEKMMFSERYPREWLYDMRNRPALWVQGIAIASGPSYAREFSQIHLPSLMRPVRSSQLMLRSAKVRPGNYFTFNQSLE